MASDTRLKVSETTLNMVWQNMFDAARLVRYYEKLSSRYRLYSQLIRGVLLVSATGIAADAFDVLPQPIAIKEGVEGIFGVLVIVAILCDFLMEFSGKAEVLRIVSAQCSSLESQWYELWGDLIGREAVDANIRSRNADLDSRLTAVTGLATEKIRPNKRLNRSCAQEASRIMQQRFATDYATSAP